MNGLPGLVIAILVGAGALAAEPVAFFAGGQVTRDRIEAENVVGAAGVLDLKSIKADKIFATGGVVTLGDMTADKAVAAAGTLDVTARDVGSAELAGGTVSFTGKVRDDLSLAGGTVTVAPGSTIGGDVAIEAGTITFDGTVEGATRLEADSLALSGKFGGDVVADSRRVKIAAGTSFGGDLSLPRAAGFVLPEGVTVAGDTKIGTKSASMAREGYKVTVNIDDEDAVKSATEKRIEDQVNAAIADAKHSDKSEESGLIWPRPLGMGGWFMVLATLAACGGLALAVAPQFVAGAAQRLAQQPLESLGLGLGSLVVVPLALFLVGLTVIGIPLAVLGAAAYAIGVGLGLIALCLWGGLMVRTFTSQPGQETRVHKLVGWTLMGFLALAVVGGIPIVGRWIQILAVMTGAGAVLATAWAARRQKTVALA